MLEVRAVTYHKEGKALLHDVNLTIEPHKVTSILGPNGAGKSTLLKALAGYLNPQQGEITLQGKALQSYSADLLAQKRAVQSQSLHIAFPFKVIDIVTMGRNPYKHENPSKSQTIAMEALKQVEAYELKDRTYTSLSGGEQQRVQLARVLTQLDGQEDACLLLDEPISALDIKHQHKILALCKALSREKGFTLVVILHDIRHAYHYTDQVILLKAGQVYAQGNTKKTLNEQALMDVFEISQDQVELVA